jgi:pimeloyl-ACP methyl ester carboxylesterase
VTVWSSSTVTSADATPIALQSAGAGTGLLVVGGALRASVDYLPLADVLARRFHVHVVDRRGRGLSGPQGDHYSLQREIEDLLAVRGHTGAPFVFGHSYGGLVALQTAARNDGFERVVAYEPGVSIDGSIPTEWTTRYRHLLASNDRRGAFAHFVKHSGGAPRITRSLPSWYLQMVLRLAIRGEEWERMDALQETSANEHDEIAQVDNDPALYQAIDGRVLLLGGQRSPAFMTATPFEMLRNAIARCEVDLLPGLDHLAPDDKDPETIALRVQRFLESD